jgi:hypothetical protein
MTTLRNFRFGRCLGGGSVKNTCVLLSAMLICGLAGCAPAVGPRSATPVLLEDEVKVRVDKDGHSHVGAEAGAKTEAAPKAETEKAP